MSPKWIAQHLDCNFYKFIRISPNWASSLLTEQYRPGFSDTAILWSLTCKNTVASLRWIWNVIFILSANESQLALTLHVYFCSLCCHFNKWSWLQCSVSTRVGKKISPWANKSLILQVHHAKPKILRVGSADEKSTGSEQTDLALNPCSTTLQGQLATIFSISPSVNFLICKIGPILPICWEFRSNKRK